MWCMCVGVRRVHVCGGVRRIHDVCGCEEGIVDGYCMID